jgi:hypothetical protein
MTGVQEEEEKPGKRYRADIAKSIEHGCSAPKISWLENEFKSNILTLWMAENYFWVSVQWRR